jgi:hypothetical protein
MSNEPRITLITRIKKAKTIHIMTAASTKLLFFLSVLSVQSVVLFLASARAPSQQNHSIFQAYFVKHLYDHAPVLPARGTWHCNFDFPTEDISHGQIEQQEFGHREDQPLAESGE